MGADDCEYWIITPELQAEIDRMNRVDWPTIRAQIIRDCIVPDGLQAKSRDARPAHEADTNKGCADASSYCLGAEGTDHSDNQ